MSYKPKLDIEMPEAPKIDLEFHEPPEVPKFELPEADIEYFNSCADRVKQYAENAIASLNLYKIQAEAYRLQAEKMAKDFITKPKIQYRTETLYHFKCSCGQWWTIGDFEMKEVICTNCGNKAMPVEIEE